jgi:hypothetical protein
MKGTVWSFLAGALAFILLVPFTASAQQASGIAGVARDTSGSVLPGVTVEASSSALIEKVRTGVTDGEGRYNIVNLPPGTYTVTFTLPGFNVFKREGVAITAGFTAAVNADMQVGAVEETITVSGEAPLVDTQNVRRQSQVSQEDFATLPLATKNVNSLVSLTPGVSGYAEIIAGHLPQVGGPYHGKGNTQIQFDGMNLQQPRGDIGPQPNTALVEAVTMQTSGISAESNADGPLFNMVPRSGGNAFNGGMSGYYSGSGLQSDNLSQKLRDRQLTTVNKVLSVYDATLTLGGPIKKDKVWFFGSLREWGNAKSDAGLWWNKTQGSPFYTPDLARPSDRRNWFESKAVRVTWQASKINKVNAFVDVQDTCVCRSSTAIGQAPESITAFHFRPSGVYQAAWTAPVNSKLLFDAGGGVIISSFVNYRAPGVLPSHVSILEQSTGMRYNAAATYSMPWDLNRYTSRFSASYVTGSHAIKTGVQLEKSTADRIVVANADEVSYTFNTPTPNSLPTTVSITEYATPYNNHERVKADMGIYAQDQWTIRRLTLNYGVRFDYFNAYIPEQHIPATRFVQDRTFAAVPDVPNWKDWSPRLGGAYDLFGDGKTAIKVTLGRYVAKNTLAVPEANNPVTTSVNQVNRSWTDTNGNYIPDCDLLNRGLNGECGPLANQNFGGLQATTRWADEVLHGSGREFNWDMSSEIQRQVSPTMSVSGGYYRNWFGNFRVTDNLAVAPADYNEYCIKAPPDSRLPGGGGQQMCGLYDITPTKFGLSNNLVTKASNFGKQRRVNDFFNITLTGKIGSRIDVGGGFDTGRSLSERCFVVDSPQELRDCKVVTPFSAQTQVKLHGSYRLPGEVFLSGVFQNMSGPEIDASYSATNAEIAPSLNRNLAGNARTAPVAANLVPLGTMFEGRITRLDLRVSKRVSISKRLRADGYVDAYNIMNGSAILTGTNVYGPRWLLPTTIVEGRLVQFGANISF